MSNLPLTIQVPGKLMIAGEFAVLEPYHNLVVMAVNRFVYATISQNDANRLSLLDFQLLDLEWNYSDNRTNIVTNDERVRFVEEAMTIALNYLKESGITPGKFNLSIKSELDDESGVKYGLGSSAAVVTSVISAILHKFLRNEPSAALIFKLASISHVKTQGNGSGADIAASSYGGWQRYTSFQAEWLANQYKQAGSLTGLLGEDWPYFSVEPIVFPEDVYMCIGWTGKPASTANLVTEIRKLNENNATLYKRFLQGSTDAVEIFLQGFRKKDVDLLLKGTKLNRNVLSALGKNAGVEIETPLLKTLCDLAEQHGGAGKPSGAGGGDCGIAFVPSKEKAEQLMMAWQEVGIKPLEIRPNPHGARVIK
ncbi:phosphomevalonate kinase [Virgibacillus oceani]|uniref:phosphomevalonate kinase n=1 Tax=Virgibacillus oceani TaxID=1479511 RepID=A0A917MB84_9BACI|nr:phosphomevalonate kinase [Virgibacillus oceani]GGG86749.1 mevalonate kinase [Virgibacillus oceani]